MPLQHFVIAQVYKLFQSYTFPKGLKTRKFLISLQLGKVDDFLDRKKCPELNCLLLPVGKRMVQKIKKGVSDNFLIFKTTLISVIYPPGRLKVLGSRD